MLKKEDDRSPIWNKILRSFEQIMAIVETDIRKLRHDPFELFTRMIQPAVWLLIFGQAMDRSHVIPTGNLSYLDYIAPGILAQSILFMAIFFGIALIWERDMGILHKILVSPAPRITLVVGRAMAAAIRGLSQIFIVYILAFFLGVSLRFDLLSLLGVISTVMLAGAIFSTLSLIVAAIVKKRERFMGIGQVLTMPLFFASNALYPLEMMPGWIRTISLINPLTYQVDALRSLMIAGQISHFGLITDFAVGIFAFFFLVAIAVPIYPRILY